MSTVGSPLSPFSPNHDFFNEIHEKEELKEKLFYSRLTKSTIWPKDFLSEKEVYHRFSNIGCAKETAVRVANTFFHANLLKSKGCTGSFIASQAPTNNKDSHLFWQLVLENKSTIFDLTMFCDWLDTYYPEKIGDSMKHGDIVVTLENIVDEGGNHDIHFYQVTNGTSSQSIQRHHYCNWYDGNEISISDLDILVDRLKKQGDKSLVHCSAGVGRTGTLITAFFLKEKILDMKIDKENLESELINLIVELRQQRNTDLVKTPKQLETLLQYGVFLLK